MTIEFIEACQAYQVGKQQVGRQEQGHQVGQQQIGRQDQGHQVGQQKLGRQEQGHQVGQHLDQGPGTPSRPTSRPRTRDTK